MLNINDYYNEINKVWLHIEEKIEEFELDLDYEQVGSVLTLENNLKEQIVINRQEPKLELWLAYRRGASHYIFKDNQWVHTQTGLPFWHYLNEAFASLGYPKCF